jgi:hypothetical protein
MTNKEYIVSMLDRYSVTDDVVDAILDKNGIDGAGTVGDYAGLDTAICRYLPHLFGVSGWTEGDAGSTYNLEGLKSLYYFLCGELGITPMVEKPVIVKNASSRW